MPVFLIAAKAKEESPPVQPAVPTISLSNVRIAKERFNLEEKKVEPTTLERITKLQNVSVYIGYDLSKSNLKYLDGTIKGALYLDKAIRGAKNSFVESAPLPDFYNDQSAPDNSFVSTYRQNPDAYGDFDNWRAKVRNTIWELDNTPKKGANLENHLVLFIDDDHSIEAGFDDEGANLSQNERELSTTSLIREARRLGLKIHVVLMDRGNQPFSTGPEGDQQNINLLRNFCLKTGGTFTDQSREKTEVKASTENFLDKTLGAVEGAKGALSKVEITLGSAPKLELYARVDDYFDNKKYSASVGSSFGQAKVMNSIINDFHSIWTGYASASFMPGVTEKYYGSMIGDEEGAKENLAKIISCAKQNIDRLKPQSDIEALYIIHRTIFTQLGGMHGYNDNLVTSLSSMIFDCKGSIVEYDVAKALGINSKMKYIPGSPGHVLISAKDADGKEAFLETTQQSQNIIYDYDYALKLAVETNARAERARGSNKPPLMLNAMLDFSESQMRSFALLKHAEGLVSFVEEYDGGKSEGARIMRQACNTALRFNPNDVLAHLMLNDYEAGMNSARTLGGDNYVELVIKMYPQAKP